MPRVDAPTAADSRDSVPKLHSPEQEQSAHSTAGAPSQEHTPVSSLRQETRTPDDMQPKAPEVQLAAPETSSGQARCQSGDELANKPAGPQAALQVHPADVLAHAAEMEPAEGRRGTAQAKAAQATEASGHEGDCDEMIMDDTDLDQDTWAHGPNLPSTPQPSASKDTCKLPWLPSASDLQRLWAPALVLSILTNTFDARGASCEVLSTCIWHSSLHDVLLW